MRALPNMAWVPGAATATLAQDQKKGDKKERGEDGPVRSHS